MKDFLEQLAEMPLGDVPAEFDRQLHRRLNRSLLVQHVVELLTGAVPWALWHFFRAAIAVAGFTLTGKFGDGKKD
jgi:hypothetical protein